jgi:hypothetical protein
LKRSDISFAAKRPGEGSQMCNVWNTAQPNFPALKVRPAGSERVFNAPAVCDGL